MSALTADSMAANVLEKSISFWNLESLQQKAWKADQVDSEVASEGYLFSLVVFEGNDASAHQTTKEELCF